MLSSSIHALWSLSNQLVQPRAGCQDPPHIPGGDRCSERQEAGIPVISPGGAQPAPGNSANTMQVCRQVV